MESENRLRVAVVGAGLAGLGAASRLASAGCDVVLVEREARAGGGAIGTSEAGFALDSRVTLLTSTDRNLASWIAEMGLGDEFLPPRTVQLAQLLRGRVHAIDPGSLAGIARIPGVNPLDWRRLPRFERLLNRYRPLLDPEVPERAASLDSRSAADFGRLYFGKSLFERWITPTLTTTHLNDEAELSRVAFLLEWIAQREGSASVGIPRAGLHRLAETAAAKLAVHLGREVQRVEARASGGFHVHCRARSGIPTGHHADADWSIPADAVVIATASNTAGRIAASLLTPAERDFLRSVRYSPALTLSAALDRPLARVPQHVRVAHADGWPIEHYLLEPGTGGRRAPPGCGLATLGATECFALAHENVADEVVEKALLEAMERIYPQLRAVLLFARLTRCSGAVPQFHVGAYRALERFQRVQLDRRSLGRRLYFAGDHLCGPRPENALTSGFRAARALLADYRSTLAGI